MKLILITALAFSSLLACKNHLLFKGWVVDEKHVVLDSAFVDGKMEHFAHAIAFTNSICPDSMLAAKSDSIRAAAAAKAKAVK